MTEMRKKDIYSGEPIVTVVTLTDHLEKSMKQICPIHLPPALLGKSHVIIVVVVFVVVVVAIVIDVIFIVSPTLI